MDWWQGRPYGLSTDLSCAPRQKRWRAALVLRPANQYRKGNRPWRTTTRRADEGLGAKRNECVASAEATRLAR